MLVVAQTAIRSVWSLVLLLAGLVFALLGVSVVVEAAASEEFSIDPGVIDVVLGLVISGYGGGLCRRAVRRGAFRTPGGLLLRDTRSRPYTRSQIEALAVAEDFDTILPIATTFPVLVLTSGDRVEIRALAHYSVTRRGRQRVRRATDQIAAWVERPVIDDLSQP